MNTQMAIAEQVIQKYDQRLSDTCDLASAVSVIIARAEAAQQRSAELEQAVNEARTVIESYEGGYVEGCQCEFCTWLAAHPAPDAQPTAHDSDLLDAWHDRM